MNLTLTLERQVLRAAAVFACLVTAGQGLAGTRGIYTQYPEPNPPGVAGFNTSAPVRSASCLPMPAPVRHR